MKDINIFQLKEDISEDTKELETEVLKMISSKGIKCINVNLFFEYVIKIEDRRCNRNDRTYYIHNTSLDSISNDSQVVENVARCNDESTEEKVMKKISDDEKREKLSKCTVLQQNRYKKHVYHGFSYAKIARQENVSENTIRNTIVKVFKKLNE